LKSSILTKDQEAKALEIHRKAIVVDGLASTALSAFNHEHVQRLKSSGVTGVCVSVPTADLASLSQAIEEIARWTERLGELSGDKVRLVTTAREIRDAKQNNGIAVSFSTQGAAFLGYDLNNLEIFHKLGLRTLQPTYQRANQFGDGTGEKRDAGLSELGIKWVDEMNRKHLLISLTHVGYKTCMETMKYSKDPVVFSHSNAYGLVGDVGNRNIRDEEIKACTEKGGVIGITTGSMYLSYKPANEVTVEDYLDHIDYVAKLSGVDHVGIGLDLPETFYTAEEVMIQRVLYPDLHPERICKWHDQLAKSGRQKISHNEVYNPWLTDIAQIHRITGGLVARGYSDQDITKILGGNFLRVFERVWGS
jgi:membrane dipeptidase